jgi:hypothetical protein
MSALERVCCFGIATAFLEEVGVALLSPGFETADGMSFLRFKQRSAHICTFWEGGKYTLVVRLQLCLLFRLYQVFVAMIPRP